MPTDVWEFLTALSPLTSPTADAFEHLTAITATTGDGTQVDVTTATDDVIVSAAGGEVEVATAGGTVDVTENLSVILATIPSIEVADLVPPVEVEGPPDVVVVFTESIETIETC